jgi:hypothetical protein
VFESRWSPSGVAKFSPDQKYLAVSYPAFDSLRIFSVADRRELLEAKLGSTLGGTWLAGGSFVWANTDAVRQWVPAGTTTILRYEHWYGPVASPDGEWLAGTLLTDPATPHAVVVSLKSGRTYDFPLTSTPGFASSTLLLVNVEDRCPPLDRCGADPTAATRYFHAFDPTNGSDQMSGFNAGDEPYSSDLDFLCCAPGD